MKTIIKQLIPTKNKKIPVPIYPYVYDDDEWWGLNCNLICTQCKQRIQTIVVNGTPRTICGCNKKEERLYSTGIVCPICKEVVMKKIGSNEDYCECNNVKDNKYYYVVDDISGSPSLCKNCSKPVYFEMDSENNELGWIICDCVSEQATYHLGQKKCMKCKSRYIFVNFNGEVFCTCDCDKVIK